MKPTRFLIAFVLFATVALAGCTSPGNGGDDAGKLVKLENTKFDPMELTIEAGTTVLWRNLDSFSHTVTADDDSFDSGNMNGGETFRQTFDEPGTYKYHCTPHAFKDSSGNYTQMIGTIIVTNATA